MSEPDAMPHGELLELFPDVFWMQGSVRMFPGMTINRVMVVLRHEGDLAVINAIRPRDRSALDALGKVTTLVKLGSHGMDDAWFARTYQPRVLVGEAPVPWARAFRFETSTVPEHALLVERGGGLLVTCDAVQNWPDTALCSTLGGFATWAGGFNARPAQIGPIWRSRATPKGGTLRPDFERLLELPFDHLVGGHGAPLIGGAKAALRATVEATFAR